MTLQELLANPGRKVCHLVTLIDRYPAAAVIALVLAGVVLGVILIVVSRRARPSGFEELQAADAVRGNRGG